MKIEIKELINTEEVLRELEKLTDYRKIEDKIIDNQRDVLFGVLCSMFADNKEMTGMHSWIGLNFNTASFKRVIGREPKKSTKTDY